MFSLRLFAENFAVKERFQPQRMQGKDAKLRKGLLLVRLLFFHSSAPDVTLKIEANVGKQWKMVRGFGDDWRLFDDFDRF